MKKELLLKRYVLVFMLALSVNTGCTLPERVTNPDAVSKAGSLGDPCVGDEGCERNLVCVDDVCVRAAAIGNDAGTDAESTLADSGMVVTTADGGEFIEDLLSDSGLITIIDAGNGAVENLDSGTIQVPPFRTWGESCTHNSASTCAHGLSCINGFCEEVCESLGLCENCCPLSGAPFCEPINPDLSVCKKKAGLLIELTWASEYNNFDLYFSKAQYEHCHEQNSCYYRNCQLSSENPADFSGDGPTFSESDPVMIIADICGYGPETIHLGGASFGNYQVGIHLNNNDALCLINEEQNAATATVTIYLDNNFHSEYSSTFAANGDFWELGYLDWINNELQVMAFNGYESNWICGDASQP